MSRIPAFIGPSYTSKNKLASDDETINWFPAKIESGTGTNDYTLEPAAGFVAGLELPESPVRGFFTLNGATFVVGGEKLYELTINDVVIERASGLSNLNNQLVNFACNGDAGHQIEMVSDSTVYCFDLLTNTLTTVADQTASDVVFQDGYFVILNPNTSTISQSELENGLVFDEAAQRNDNPDKWVKMLSRPAAKEIWLFGSETTSVYYNAGNDGFVFIPNPSVAISYGTAAPESPALLGGAPIWLANDKTVRYANGYTAQRISTYAMEWQIASYSTVLDADGSVTHSIDGHQFYVLSFPTAGVTWVYDLTSGLWHKRGLWNGLAFGALPVWGYTFAFGRHLVGSRTTGMIYQMSTDFSTDTDGNGMRRLRRAPHLLNGLKRTNFYNFQLHMEVGLGLPSGQGSDPQAMLRWSNDGGQTFGNYLNASAGPIGAYGTRVRWPGGLGQARDRVFEVTVSDPVPWRIVDAYVDARVGTS